ncbi:hypothetical protein [Thiolapillus sp.]
MTDDEVEEFSAAWCGASLTIGAENRLDEDAVIMAFESLKDDYSIPQVKYALNQIVRDTKHRYWLITPADIIRKIDGETPSADKFIGLARAKNTPLGIVAFTIVGGDIDRQDAYYLRQRGEELVIRYEADLKPRLLRGEYTDHELRLMIKYQVDPCAPICDTILPPRRNSRLLQRIEAIKNPDKCLGDATNRALPAPPSKSQSPLSRSTH